MADNSGGEIVGSFVVGALVGAVLGVLFAPAAGKETREKLNEWMDENKEMAKEKLEKLEAEIKRRKEQLLKHAD